MHHGLPPVADAELGQTPNMGLHRGLGVEERLAKLGIAGSACQPPKVTIPQAGTFSLRRPWPLWHPPPPSDVLFGVL